ncbi:hypothetical protein CFO_g3360 [Ceratocystis platani]|uniref:Uncharacterized protein n=1 Tax=Ceratocystis fimbriata f. sp. platani TaxID=88771 RepID=A0A0F8B086_CERFI|nr:hypothetical protein CFO_g3360 [Ceratocystis platani]
MSWIIEKFFRGEPRHWLYVCVYDTGFIAESSTDSRYHWALIIGPNSQNTVLSGTKHHIRKALPSSSDWSLEQVGLKDARFDFNLIVRVAVAEVTDPTYLDKTLATVPVINGVPY